MPLIDDILKKDKLTDGKYMLICYSGLAVTAERNGSGYKPVLAEENDGASQLFNFSLDKYGEWEISLSENSGYCLDICSCSSADGTPLIAYPRNNTPAQRFKAEKDKDGYRLLTAASGFKKYLAVASDGKSLVQSSARDEKSLWAIC